MVDWILFGVFAVVFILSVLWQMAFFIFINAGEHYQDNQDEKVLEFAGLLVSVGSLSLAIFFAPFSLVLN